MGTRGGDLLGVVGLGVHRVGSDDVAVQVELVQQRDEGEDFVALRGGLPLGDHCLGLVQDGGGEVNGFLVAAAAAAYGLAIGGQAHQQLVVLDRVGRVAGEPDTDGVVEGVTVDAGQQTAQGGGAREAAR
ncbi:hypothetical protein TNCT6_75670 [Streptomyces sp. 6-11-2]|nr:hypothetical protein [Streptomyces sp. 6-11-2]GED90482.1 hypothetical protein TNCT6_75670 [Streptomyces sp. 6-11-2]